MKPVFADTSYWVALLFPRDHNHSTATDLAKQIASDRRRIVTSQMALVELLNFFAGYGTSWRTVAIDFVKRTLLDPNTLVIEQTDTQFQAGLRL